METTTLVLNPIVCAGMLLHLVFHFFMDIRVLVAMRRLYIPQEQMPVIDSAMRKFLIKEKHLSEAEVMSRTLSIM